MEDRGKPAAFPKIFQEESAWLNPVRNIGHLIDAEVAAQLHTAHVFCLLSGREPGRSVLLKSMAVARPVIAIAHGGPAEMVGDSIGRAIPPNSPEMVVEALAQTLRDVFAKPDTWQRRGEEGGRRAEQRYGWDAKIEQILRLYCHVRGDRQAVEVT